MKQSPMPCSSQLHERGQRILVSVSRKLLSWRHFGKYPNVRSLELSHTDTNRLMGVVQESSEEQDE